MPADLSTFAIGGGSMGALGIAGWQMLRMFNSDKQTGHLHQAANQFASQLMNRIDAADKENIALKHENLEQQKEIGILNTKVASLSADLKILKAQTQSIVDMVDKLKKENECLCQENKELKQKPVGTADIPGKWR